MPQGGKKNYKVRTSARSVSKGMEKELKRKAKRLAQDVDLALPRTTVRVPYIEKLRDKLKDVQKVQDNKRALESYSKKGEKLVRAYAGTLMLLHEEKLQYLAIFKGPFGEVVYASRGSTSPERLVGIQNYDQPKIKMMAYIEDVRKKGLFMFVTESELICTGKDPTPPNEVIDGLPKALGKGMRRNGSIIHSPDIDPSIARKRSAFIEPYLVVNWKSAKIDIARTLTHAQQNPDNVYATCASYIASPNISDYFSVEAVVRPLCDSEGKDCVCNPPPIKEEKLSFLQRLGKVKEETDDQLYLKGKMMDHRLIEKAQDRYEAALKDSGRRVFLIHNRCLGSDRRKLTLAISPKEGEKAVLEAFLDLSKGPIISPDPSINRVIGQFWPDIGEDILKKVVNDDGIAHRAFAQFPYPRFQPIVIVDEARFMLEERKIRSLLKPPVDPPKMIEFAYECAIGYLTRGKEGASRALDRFHEDDIKLKAAKYAFIKQLGLEKVGGWSYTTHEVGYAQGMGSIVEKIITKDPSKFKEGLKELWKATGSTKDLIFA